MALGVMILARRRLDWQHVTRECRWLIIFYIYLLLSTLWSDYTFVSFKRWFKDVGDVLMVLVILTEVDPVAAFRWVFLRVAYVLIPVSVIFIKYYPDLGRYYNQWTWQTGYCGVSNSKNGLALLAMWSGLVLVWQIVDVHRGQGKPMTLRRLWPELILLLMCLWILRIADSSTSLVCFIVGTAVFFGSRLPRVRASFKNIGLYITAIAAFLLIMTSSSEIRGAIAGALGRDANLTDRTEIWDWALGLHTNPLIGTGFASTLLTFKDEPLVKLDGLPHVHNGYLQTYIDTGMIGVCLILAIIFKAGRNAVRQLSEHAVFGHLFVAILMSSLLFNYTEVGFNRSNTIGFLVWVLAAYGIVANQLARYPAEAHSELPDPSPSTDVI